MSRTAERILWVTVGAAIGAGIALLYAPRSGKDTRKYLRRRADDAREALLEAGESVVDAGREWVDQVAEQGRDMYESVLDKGREAYKKGTAAAADAATGAFERGRKAVWR